MVNLIKSVFLCSLLLTLSSCFAVDNPDTPDYVNEFLAEAQVFEDKISQGSGNANELREQYKAFNQFLAQRLSHSERLVDHFLQGEAKTLFKDSQALWKSYANKESEVILSNFTKENVGSSYLLTRFAYVATVNKQRIITLYGYAKNYPSL